MYGVEGRGKFVFVFVLASVPMAQVEIFRIESFIVVLSGRIVVVVFVVFLTFLSIH